MEINSMPHLTHKRSNITGNEDSSIRPDYYSCTLKSIVMTGNEILKADLLDILFDNRNKDYGAYRLRKFYNNRLIFSLSVALGSIFLLFILFDPENARTITTRSSKVVDLTEVNIPAEKKKIEIPHPKKTIASSEQRATQRKFVTRLEIVRDNTVIKDKMPPNKSLEGEIISDIDRFGVPGGPKIPININTAGYGSDPKSKSSTNEAPLINRAPEFPGGPDAWLRFLNRNLRTPDDLQPGEKKTVMIRFEVAADGSVTSFQVIQSGGTYYDNEVIRVLKKMPKWKPALQSSQPVPVAFTQPVTFMGIESD